MLWPAILLPAGLTPQSAGAAPYGQNDDQAQSTMSNDITRFSHLMMFGVILTGVLSCWATTISRHFPTMATSYNLTAATGALMVSACMVACTGAKVLYGILSDRAGNKTTLHVLSAAILPGLSLAMTSRVSVILIGAALMTGMAGVGIVRICKELFPAEDGRIRPSR